MKKISFIKELGIIFSLGYGGDFVSTKIISPTLKNTIMKKNINIKYEKSNVKKIIYKKPKYYKFSYVKNNYKFKSCNEKFPNTKNFLPTYDCYNYNKNEFFRYYIKKEYHNLFNTKKINIIKNKNDFIVWINFMKKSNMLNWFYYVSIKKMKEKEV